MAFPSLKRPEQRRRGAGVSLPEITIRRLDVLAGGTGQRSKFVETLILDGLERRYGPHWAEIADFRIEDRAEVPA